MKYFYAPALKSFHDLFLSTRAGLVLFFAVFSLFPYPVHAATEPRLVFPVDCIIGDECGISRYADVDNKPSVGRDYTCGEQTRDGYPGTDIALRNFNVLKRGIPVLAVDAGVVTDIDASHDNKIWTGDREDSAKIDPNSPEYCGNKITITHKNEWQSTYCHLDRRSIILKQGDAVHAGDRIGAIGLSGHTGWPHLMFILRHYGNVTDPFSGRTPIEGCAAYPSPLWKKGVNIPYNIGLPLGYGFDTVMPAAYLIEGGRPSAISMSSKAPAMYLWAYVMGLRENDIVTLQIYDPNSAMIMNFNQVIKSPKDRELINAARIRSNASWQTGSYRGVITLTRKGFFNEKKTVFEQRLRVFE